MARAVLALAVIIAAEAAGCVYSKGNLDAGYKNYPRTVGEEHARRATRRKWALIAAPIEIVVGTGLTALALYAPIERSSDGGGSWSDGLGDGAKEIAGRILLATIGGAAVLGGIGDGVLGATDPLIASPLVRDGVLVPKEDIDTIAPAPGPRLGFHFTELLALTGPGSDAGAGLAHWPRPSVRVRETVAGTWSLDWRGADVMRAGVSADVSVERAFGRKYAGLYPRGSIGAYGGAAWLWDVDGGRDTAVLRAGASTTSGVTQIRLGVTYTTADRHPTIELGLRRELATD